MKINDKSYTRKEIQLRANPATLYGTRRVELTHGRGRGHRLIEVKTAGGLRATLSEDKCLDIIDLEYRGVNLAFMSKNGIVNHPIANPDNPSFVKYWQGGFLATCGLRNAGNPCEQNGEYFPLHGHIGMTPAENINITEDDENIIITGKIRETSLFGHQLELVRTITIPVDGAKITVRDAVHNLAPEAETILLLYHINFGFPFLSEDLKAIYPKGEVRGRTDYAHSKLDEHTIITAPIESAQETVFFHDPADKDVRVVLENKPIGIKAELSWNRDELPILSQWRCMRAGDYALGIEPTTSYIRGRKEEMEHGYNLQIAPFGKLEFGFVLDLKEAGN